MLALSGFADRGGGPRRSPVEIIATMGSYLTRTQAAEVSAHFQPPWPGKFASDCFHPSQAGYRDWARALLATLDRVDMPLVR
jgi:lysophospholipase L1-like esterase